MPALRQRPAPADRVRAGAGRAHGRSGRHDPPRLHGRSRRVRSEPRAAVPRGGRGAAGARVPAERSRAMLAQADLRGRAPHGRCARRRAARARAFGRAAGDDPVGQCDRSRAADARRLHGGRAGRADLGRVFAAKPGLRQAQAHRRAARARPDLRRRHRAVRQGARGDRRRRRNRREPRRRESRQRRRSTNSRARRAGPAVDQAAAATRRRHDRENPVHLRLDRAAQGRHQHPRHADREPAAGRCNAGRSSPSSR